MNHPTDWSWQKRVSDPDHKVMIFYKDEIFAVLSYKGDPEKVFDRFVSALTLFLNQYSG